jgi:hypothetical protein
MTTTMRYLAPLLLVACIAPAHAASDYTVYELLAPTTHSFDILYDVSIDREGAAFFFNPIRPGSVATNERVIDLTTGKPLEFGEVDAKTARESGLVRGRIADDQKYIRVKFAHPVPKNGEVRIRIYKTYTDPPSYYQTSGKTAGPASGARGSSAAAAGSPVTGSLTIGGQPAGGPATIGVVATGSVNCQVFDATASQVTGPCVNDTGFIFDRPLGIKRNVVVLPRGYELVGSQSPGIVSTDADGRVRISFLNDRDDQLPVKIVGRKIQ